MNARAECVCVFACLCLCRQVRMSLGGLDGMILHLSRRTAQTDAAANAARAYGEAAAAATSMRDRPTAEPTRPPEPEATS